MRLLPAILLLMPLCALAQTQVPNVFEDGKPAKAAEVNENFQYVLENASGGCSVEQVDNTAEITCADGTTAVVPGYGTVVVYPEGEVGAPPDVGMLASGDIVAVDADGVVLAKVLSNAAGYINVFVDINGGEVGGGETSYTALINDENGQSVYYGPANYIGKLLYSQADCAGPVFIEGKGNLLWDSVSNTLYFPTTWDDPPLQTLMKSFRTTGHYKTYGGDAGIVPTESCVNEDMTASNLFLGTAYTPATEILNAAYPVRLEQLP